MGGDRLIGVYCGASSGLLPEYGEAAREFGTALVQRGYGLVYGGSNVGLMRVASGAVLEAGGEVVGVIPRCLADRGLAREDCSELLVTDSMHERKARILERSCGLAVLPGGIGTLDELFEALTWSDLGLHPKPIGLLDTLGYWDPLLAMIEHAARQGFARPEVGSSLRAFRDPHALIDALSRPVAMPTIRWVG